MSGTTTQVKVSSSGVVPVRCESVDSVSLPRRKSIRSVLPGYALRAQRSSAHISTR